MLKDQGDVHLFHPRNQRGLHRAHHAHQVIALLVLECRLDADSNARGSAPLGCGLEREDKRCAAEDILGEDPVLVAVADDGGET